MPTTLGRSFILAAIPTTSALPQGERATVTGTAAEAEVYREQVRDPEIVLHEPVVVSPAVR